MIIFAHMLVTHMIIYVITYIVFCNHHMIVTYMIIYMCWNMILIYRYCQIIIYRIPLRWCSVIDIRLRHSNSREHPGGVIICQNYNIPCLCVTPGW